MEVGLKALERENDVTALEEREDFVFEEVNAYAVRHKALQGIIAALEGAPLELLDSDEKERIATRLARYREIDDDCRSRVQDLVSASETLVQKNLRNLEDHATLKDWAKVVLSSSQSSGPTPAPSGSTGASGGDHQ